MNRAAVDSAQEKGPITKRAPKAHQVMLNEDQQAVSELAQRQACIRVELAQRAAWAANEGIAHRFRSLP
jgi:hypothetical protein